MVLDLRDGVPPAGSRLFCPRSERRFGMFSLSLWAVASCCLGPSGYSHHMGWVCWSVPSSALPPVVAGASPFLLLDGLRTSVWGFSSRPAATGGFPGDPRWGSESSGVLGSLPCSSLAEGTVPRPPALPLIPSTGCLLCLALFPFGWASPSDRGLSSRPLAAGAITVSLTAAVSLWEFWPLSLVLPLQGSAAYLAFVSQFGALSESLIPSLAPSWWSPCPLLRWSLMTLSGSVLSVPSAFSLHQSCLSIPFAMSPLSLRVFAGSFSPLRAVALAEGHLLVRWVPSETMGFAVAPPISPSTGPGQSPQSGRQPLGAQVGVSYFCLRAFPQVFMAIVYLVSLNYTCPSLKCPVGLCYLDTWRDEWLGWLMVPLLALPGLCRMPNL